MGPETLTFPSDAVPEGALTAASLGPRRVVLARVGGTVYAVGGVCPHLQGPLGKGVLRGRTLVCPLHHWAFDVATGVCLEGGRNARIPCYPVCEEGEVVTVELGGEKGS